ncbi:MAG: hypothetical protein EOO96_01155 [Pedobacter sp.]|nr:MAG: hypothetical protein EOO96_01155 [Pedobacter sp.]
MDLENENSPNTDNPSERLRSEDRATSSGGVPSENNDPDNKNNKEIITNNDEFGDDLDQQNGAHEPTADNSADSDAEEPKDVEVEERQDNEKDQLDGDELII